MIKLTYRPEIDGLRAIAVGAVILYHAQTTVLGYQAFEGGFIGVDIFFVISGYLITSIILKELIITGQFSFRNFYERRVRRILPVLLFIMLVSLPFAWKYLLLDDLIDFCKSILYSLGFSSNFYFHFSGQQYGAESGLLKPFLHTWSLSIEEQYYILFPIILLFVFKYFKQYLIYFLLLGFIISLLFADFESKNQSSLNFYFLYTRGWELLAGSILAYFEINKGHRSENKTLNLILPIVGLFLIIHSIFFFYDGMLHPSFYTLSPIVGVCLIIWFSDNNGLVTKLLSTKLLVGLGLISYSLYLWHYPIFAFNLIRQKYFSYNIISNEYLILLAIAVSIFTYYYIETPFRKKTTNFKKILYFIIPSLIFLIIINLLIIFDNGFLKNYGFEKNLVKIDILPKNLLNDNKEKCFGNVEGCNFNTFFDKKVFIIGDSLVNEISFDLKNQLENKNYQSSFYYIGDCLYFPEFDRILSDKKIKDKKCNAEYFNKIKKRLEKLDNQIIIFFGRYTLNFTGKRFDNKEGGKESEEMNWEYFYSKKNSEEKNIIETFKKSIEEISKKNKVILIYPLPETGWEILKLIQKKQRERSKIHLEKYQLFNILLNLDDFSTSYEVFKERNKITFNIFDDIRYDNVYKIYPHKLFCNNLIVSRCITNNGEDILFIDTVHPSKHGAKMINNLIMKKIEEIELKAN